MPLSVEVKVNDFMVETLHVGRLESYKGADKKHKYIVSEDPKMERGVKFKHRYSDGALVCAQKAIEAHLKNVS